MTSSISNLDFNSVTDRLRLERKGLDHRPGRQRRWPSGGPRATSARAATASFSTAIYRSRSIRSSHLQTVGGRAWEKAAWALDATSPIFACVCAGCLERHFRLAAYFECASGQARKQNFPSAKRPLISINLVAWTRRAIGPRLEARATTSQEARFIETASSYHRAAESSPHLTFKGEIREVILNSRTNGEAFLHNPTR